MFPIIPANSVAADSGNSEGIFGFSSALNSNTTNLVSNAGVVASDVSGVGTARRSLSACEYGGDKGIFGYGYTGSYVSMSNLVSNAGVVATDTTGVGTARFNPAATQYGGDKGIFGFGESGGNNSSLTNLVSNTGVVASDQAAVTGTARYYLAACSFN